MANVHTSSRSGFIRRGGQKRRETVWVSIAETATTLATTGAAVLFAGLDAAGLALRPFTIVRTRLMHYVSSDQGAADENYLAAIGLCVVTEEALAVGITAVPSPMSASSSDAWLLWNAIGGRFEFASGVGFNQTGRQENVDSKAMRKVEDGFDLALVIENGASPFEGTTTIKVGRMLVKLH